MAVATVMVQQRNLLKLAGPTDFKCNNYALNNKFIVIND